MSAFKTATIRIGEEEYRRLREAEEKLRYAESHKNTPGSAERNFGTIFREMEDESRDRRAEYADLAASVGEEIEKVETRTTAVMQNHVNMITRSLMQDRDESAEQIANTIDRWVDSFGSVFTQQQAQLEAMWADQENRLQNERQRQQFFLGETQRWMAACQQWIDLTHQSYPHELMAPGELGLFIEELQWVDQIFQQGMVEIAGAHARQLFTQVMRLQQRLETDWAVVVSLHRHIIHQIDDLRAQMSRDRSIPAMDLDGNLLDEKIDVEFWLPGRLKQLDLQVEQMINQISNRDYISREELIDILEKQIPSLQRSEQELVSQARFVALSSQIRFNIAQIVLQALQEQGFYPVEAHYENEDYRGGFEAITQNSSSSKVTVTIDPAQIMDQGGILHIQSNDAAEITDHELRERNREIFRSLAEFGLRIDNISEEPFTSGVSQTESLLQANSTVQHKTGQKMVVPAPRING